MGVASTRQAPTIPQSDSHVHYLFWCLNSKWIRPSALTNQCSFIQGLSVALKNKMADDNDKLAVELHGSAIPPGDDFHSWYGTLVGFVKIAYPVTYNPADKWF